MEKGEKQPSSNVKFHQLIIFIPFNRLDMKNYVVFDAFNPETLISEPLVFVEYPKLDLTKIKKSNACTAGKLRTRFNNIDN